MFLNPPSESAARADEENLMMEKVDQDQVHRAEVQVENQEIMLGRSLKITKVESQKSSGENPKK